jgi:hypothetical protein
MKPLLLVLALLLAFGSLSVDAGKRHKRDKAHHEEHRTGISIEGGPIIADTHDAGGVSAERYENPMQFTAREVPVYLYVNDAIFARQQTAYNDLATKLAGSLLPHFTLIQLPWQSCAWVDADRANKPVQSISVCAESEIVRGLAGHVTMWYSKWPNVLGRVMVELDTEQAASWQGLHCHEMMHAVAGVLDDYNADLEGSCIYGWLPFLGTSDIAFLKSLYSGTNGVPQLSSGVGVQINQTGHIDPKKKRKKRR